MGIKPIKNDADYEAALAEIDRLFDADRYTRRRSARDSSDFG
jgi:antitoxin component HigA of HigAB toxin-antitoxin module